MIGSAVVQRTVRPALGRPLAAAAACMLALSACGQPAAPQVATAAPQGAAPAPTASVAAGGMAAELADYIDGRRKWVACMREHDFDLPDPDAKGDVDTTLLDNKMDPRVKKAADACYKFFKTTSEELDEYLAPPLTDAQKAANQGFTDCMRQNGVPEFPDPNAKGYIENAAVAKILTTKKSAAALKKCNSDPEYKKAFPDFTGPGVG